MFLLLNILFYISVSLVIYHFLVFPLLLLISSSFSRDEKFDLVDDENLPSVALVIAARNEEASIAEKLENSVNLDYPKDRLRIILLANGCTDNTITIAKSFENKGIEIFEYGDIGKGKAQNLAVERIDSEIIVFSDANTPYREDALRHLVRPFSDKTVGSVSGRHVYTNIDQATGSSEATYMGRYECSLRRAESKTGGLIGANGCIYAIRRDLYIPLPPGVITDMFGPLLIAAEGYRTVYAQDAWALEKSHSTFAAEYHRKELIVQRTSHSLFFFYPWLLNPLWTGRIAILLWSHKVLRWFSPPLLFFILIISLLRMISGKGTRRDLLVIGGMSIFGFAATLGRGLGDEKPVPILSMAYYLFVMFKAATLGLYKAFAKGGVVVWDHNR